MPSHPVMNLQHTRLNYFRHKPSTVPELDADTTQQPEGNTALTVLPIALSFDNKTEVVQYQTLTLPILFCTVATEEAARSRKLQA